MKKFISLLVFLLILAGPAHAYKKKYDKITGVTDASTTTYFAKYNVWSGTFVGYNVSSLKDDAGVVRNFLTIRCMAQTTYLQPDEALHLLIDDKERVTLMPVDAREREYGGMAQYLGFGISTVSRKVSQRLVYEIPDDLMAKLVSAKHVDARLSSAKFDIEGKEIKDIQKVANAFK